MRRQAVNWLHLDKPFPSRYGTAVNDRQKHLDRPFLV